MSLPASLLLGFALSTLVGVLGYARRALTLSGVLGAILTGTLIFGFGGFIPSLLLAAFFVSSTVLSKFRARAKQQFSETFQKGSRRDFGQALANGGWAAVLAIAFGISQSGTQLSRETVLLLIGYVGAIATVTADTWATEIGVLSKDAPRMITSGRVVPAGTSGGITPIGTLMALLGGAFIGVCVLLGIAILAGTGMLLNGRGLPTELPFANTLVNHWNALLAMRSMQLANGWRIVAIAAAGGLIGALFDSVLGATVQGIYFAEYDERQTEKRVDSQGNPTRLVRGWRWLDNDAVNFLSSVVGSLAAAGLGLVML